MTVAELREGALLASWGNRRVQVLEASIKDYDIAYPDDGCCSIYAKIRSNGFRKVE